MRIPIRPMSSGGAPEGAGPPKRPPAPAPRPRPPGGAVRYCTRRSTSVVTSSGKAGMRFFPVCKTALDRGPCRSAAGPIADVVERIGGRMNQRYASIGSQPISETPRNTQAFAPTAPDNRLARAVILEDLSFNLQERDDVAQLAIDMARFLPESYAVMRSKIQRHLVVVSDQDYEHLVRTSTQVSARIALNERKTTTGDGGQSMVRGDAAARLPLQCCPAVRPSPSHNRRNQDSSRRAAEVARTDRAPALCTGWRKCECRAGLVCHPHPVAEQECNMNEPPTMPGPSSRSR